MVSIEEIAQAAYNASEPLSGLFVDDAVKQHWIKVAEVVLKKSSSTEEKKISSEEFIALCEVAINNINARNAEYNPVLSYFDMLQQLAALHRVLHPKLSNDAYYRYQCVASCFIESVSFNNFPKSLLSSVNNLLTLPKDIVKVIESFKERFSTMSRLSRLKDDLKNKRARHKAYVAQREEDQWSNWGHSIGDFERNYR